MVGGDGNSGRQSAMQLSLTTIDDIMKRATKHGLAARTSPDMRFLSTRKFCKGHRGRGARPAWQGSIRLASASDFRPMVTIAEQVAEKLRGILNAMRLRASNGLAKALNGKIRGLRARAMKYRSKTPFKTAILFHFGGLENPLNARK